MNPLSPIADLDTSSSDIGSDNTINNYNYINSSVYIPENGEYLYLLS